VVPRGELAENRQTTLDARDRNSRIIDETGLTSAPHSHEQDHSKDLRVRVGMDQLQGEET
jgi:hypothetical protein